LIKMDKKKLKIEVYLAPTCPSWPELEQNLRTALESEGVLAEIIVERISPEEAKRRSLKGSPTLIINGEEFQPLEEGNWG